MPKNGGKGRNNNQAGARYGTGYCDAQCPRDMKFIDGIVSEINFPATGRPLLISA